MMTTSVGVTVAGNVVGSAANAGRFVSGLHVLGVGVAVWWGLGLVLGLGLMRQGDRADLVRIHHPRRTHGPQAR